MLRESPKGLLDLCIGGRKWVGEWQKLSNKPGVLIVHSVFFSISLQRAFNALCHSTHLYGRRLVLEWADTEETVEALRRKTAQHFHGNVAYTSDHVFEDILSFVFLPHV